MRRISAALLALVLVVSLGVTVFAASGAQSVDNQTYVSNDGTCQVTLTVLINPDTISDGLTFPIPAGARNVTLNGRSTGTTRSGNVRLVDLKGNYAPTISYTLTNLVAANELNQLVLTLPLLCGFSYPVQSLAFKVVLPGNVTAKPAFSSVYHQQSIEEKLTVSVTGAEISGTCATPLMDRESLTMTLLVPEEMFPQTAARQWSVNFDDVVMYVLAGLAALYWLLFLRCAPPRRMRCSTPPEGFTAGELGCGLIGQGADLTMMVFTWAQLGYILIHLDDNGRVVLHKRMNMGNERSSFEAKWFQQLFGKRKMVDGTGYHYAQLCRKLAAKRPYLRDLYQSRSGNPKVFRVLAALIGVFGGISLGVALAGDALLGGLLVAIFAVAGGLSAWLIQSFTRGLHLHHRDNLVLSLVCCGGWLLMGLIAGELNVAIMVVLAQLLAGLACSYGGMRTGLGRQTMSQILGLHRYFRTASAGDLQRAVRVNPEYFFSLAPYALALGVDRAFAKRFGPKRLIACPYLTTGMDAHMNAQEWSAVMRRAVASLDARQKRLPYERLFGK